MELIKREPLGYLIPISNFSMCLIDNMSRKEISKLYKRHDVTKHKSVYFLEKFQHHIKIKHNIEMKEYCKKYLAVNWPHCPINGKEVGYGITGKGIEISEFDATVNKQFSEKFRIGCEKLSRERTGSGNPMFGQESWNKGKDKRNPIIKRLAEARKGTKASEETRAKQREARRKSKFKARHTTPHSRKTRELLRKHAANLWAQGVFSKVSSIHIKMREFLNSLNLKCKFVEEEQVVYYSVDFAFKEQKIAIEADGDFFHVNPIFYPNGPECAIQKRNFGRDKAKNKFLASLGWTVLRFWECEINSGVFKEKLLCKLKELNLLND